MTKPLRPAQVEAMQTAAERKAAREETKLLIIGFIPLTLAFIAFFGYLAFS